MIARASSISRRRRADRNDGWSGWAGARDFAVARLDPAAIGRRAALKAARDEEPLDLEPGRYTVILEPTAVGELAQWLMWMLRARPADEGRSFFSRAAAARGSARICSAPQLSIRSDPRDAIAPEAPFGDEGLAQEPRRWVEQGRAARARAPALLGAEDRRARRFPPAANFTVAGGTTSLEEMIRGVRRGILVTRFWYTNMRRSAQPAAHRADARRQFPHREWRDRRARAQHALQ